MAFDFEKASGGTKTSSSGSGFGFSGNSGSFSNQTGMGNGSSSGQFSSGEKKSFDLDRFSGSRGMGTVPWKLILFAVAVLAAVVLVIVFWDEIVYMIYKLVSLVITVAVIYVLLRLFVFRRRR